MWKILLLIITPFIFLGLIEESINFFAKRAILPDSAKTTAQNEKPKWKLPSIKMKAQ